MRADANYQSTGLGERRHVELELNAARLMKTKPHLGLTIFGRQIESQLGLNHTGRLNPGNLTTQGETSLATRNNQRAPGRAFVSMLLPAG
ncbi:MAG: hypothetical protein WC763_03710 [Candidatus Paceibacterota bacterium]|jgi:hypothetical protein